MPDKSETSLFIPVSPGEVLDKLTILEIKSDRITDPAKLDNVRHEAALLRDTVEKSMRFDEAVQALTGELRHINERLWTVEDDLRACEKRRQFDADFVELARSVYRLNDERASIKRQINVLLGSSIVEEKSYGR